MNFKITKKNYEEPRIRYMFKLFKTIGINLSKKTKKKIKRYNFINVYKLLK